LFWTYRFIVLKTCVTFFGAV